MERKFKHISLPLPLSLSLLHSMTHSSHALSVIGTIIRQLNGALIQRESKLRFTGTNTEKVSVKKLSSSGSCVCLFPPLSLSRLKRTEKKALSLFPPPLTFSFLDLFSCGQCISII